jgi:hypothetical protein
MSCSPPAPKRGLLVGLEWDGPEVEGLSRLVHVLGVVADAMKSRSRPWSDGVLLCNPKHRGWAFVSDRVPYPYIACQSLDLV